MNAKKWLKIFVSISAFGILLVFIINIVVDPFNVFGTKLLKNEFQQNERFLKVKYFIENNPDINGLLIGSSRIGTTEPSTIEKYIDGSKFYNLTVSSATLFDDLMHVKYFVNKYNIKYIYLQLDIDLLLSSYKHSDSDYLRKLHPLVTNDSLVDYYRSYLSGLFVFNIKGKILKNITLDDNPTVYNILTGVWYKPVLEGRLKKNCGQHRYSNLFYTENVRADKYKKLSNNVPALQEIKKIAEENNIRLIVYITPHHKAMMDEFNINAYLGLLSDISTVTDFYDFSGYNAITMDNCNYYERNHYRPIVGDMLAAKIFSDNAVKIPNDFGYLVTKENISEYIRLKHEEIKIYDMNQKITSSFD